MGETITNKPSVVAGPPTTGRTITNAVDTGRKYPESDLVPEMLTETELDATTGVQFRLGEAQIQFVGEPFNPPASDLTDIVPVEVADGQGTRNTFAETQTVQVDISGGTATGKRLSAGGKTGAVDGSLVVDLVKGRVEVTVEATSTGTVLLALSNPSNTALDVTDTATVTFS